MAELTGTLWEKIDTTASCNHGFASHVAVTCCRDILGVKEIDYVTKNIIFEPPENLPIDSISMEIPIGSDFIVAGWNKTAGKIKDTLILPAGWNRRSEKK
jgi:alpha-L-rhamnosidase